MLPEVGEAGQVKLLSRRCSCWARAASDRRRGFTSRRRAWARSASSMPTSSTPRTSSVRSCTPPTASGCPRSNRRAGPSPAQPRREGDRAPDAPVVENVLDIITGYDVIVDGADNFPTRYLVNDAALMLGKPVVHGSIFRFDGQLTTFMPRGPVLPLPLPAAAAPRHGAVVPGGRRARRAARRDRIAAGHRGDQAPPRHR